MEEEGSLKYIRPGAAIPTRHLLLAGQEHDILRLKDSLIALGALHVTDPGCASRTHCFSTFESPATATAAATAITSNPERYGKIVFKYAEAELRKPNNGAMSVVPAVQTAEECGIPGLILLPEFVTAEEEISLLAEVDSRPWDILAKRSVQHYGRPFNYLERTVDRQAPADLLPSHSNELMLRISNLPGIGPLDQLTVNAYPSGVGISPHVETHSAFGDAIAALSLAGPAVMVFRREDDPQKALFLPRRSLLVMSGEARLAWAHYVPHRKADPLESGDVVPRGARRVSFTFRKVREEPCACVYPALCDSQDGSIPPTRAALKAEEAAAAAAEREGIQRKESTSASIDAQALEESNVQAVYDAIAPHFSATRFAVWPAVRNFIESLQPGSIVADVGCGNGKYFGIRRDIFTAGSDRSSGLATVAARRLYPPGLPKADRPLADMLVSDGLKLPYRRSSCDAVLCIAVLHHMASIERRIALLQELFDVLVPGGRALVTVWATEQENMKKVAKWEPLQSTEEGEVSKNDYLVPWHLPMHRVEAVAAANSGAESAVDAQKNSLVFRRYYHLFEPGELEGLVEQIPGAAVEAAFYDKDNWCVVMVRQGVSKAAEM